MLFLSISQELTNATEYANAFFSINFLSSNLLLWESFLESSRFLPLKFFPKITAAAVTGPAKLPLPASSTPASCLNF